MKKKEILFPGFPKKCIPIPREWGISGMMHVLKFFIPIPTIPGNSGNGNGNSRELFIHRTSLIVRCDLVLRKYLLSYPPNICIKKGLVTKLLSDFENCDEKWNIIAIQIFLFFLKSFKKFPSSCIFMAARICQKKQISATSRRMDSIKRNFLNYNLTKSSEALSIFLLNIEVVKE